MNRNHRISAFTLDVKIVKNCKKTLSRPGNVSVTNVILVWRHSDRGYCAENDSPIAYYTHWSKNLIVQNVTQGIANQAYLATLTTHATETYQPSLSSSSLLQNGFLEQRNRLISSAFIISPDTQTVILNVFSKFMI